MTRETFAEEYENGRQRTVNFLMSKGFSEQMAQETGQAAWVRGWERRGQIRDEQKTLAWVNTIALNMGRTQIRRAARMHELVDMPAATTNSIAASVDAERMLDECLAKDRSLLEKRYLQDWEMKDLAREQGCTSRAIRVRLHRARKRLRERFDRKPSLQPLALMNEPCC